MGRFMLPCCIVCGKVAGTFNDPNWLQDFCPDCIKRLNPNREKDFFCNEDVWVSRTDMETRTGQGECRMNWIIVIAIWLVLVAVIIAFNMGAHYNETH